MQKLKLYDKNWKTIKNWHIQVFFFCNCWLIIHIFLIFVLCLIGNIFFEYLWCLLIGNICLEYLWCWLIGGFSLTGTWSPLWARLQPPGLNLSQVLFSHHHHHYHHHYYHHHHNFHHHNHWGYNCPVSVIPSPPFLCHHHQSRFSSQLAFSFWLSWSSSPSASTAAIVDVLPALSWCSSPSGLPLSLETPLL